MSTSRHSPRVRLFLDTIIALSQRHSVCLAATDGDFSVVPWSRGNIEALDRALDHARGVTPITAEIGANLGDDGFPTKLRRESDLAPDALRPLLLAAADEVDKLRRGLATAIREIEHKHLLEHGYPLDSPELDALKMLLPARRAA